jgi:uncharacterized protein (DUF488 family)
MKLYTIGFTKKSAQQFFGLLKDHQVDCVLDIRLHPDGQLAGFSKKADLAYFLQRLIGCEYRHLIDLAPTDEILSSYRSHHDWAKYKDSFEALMDARKIPVILDRELFESQRCCLLCSEATPEQCHRRLVAERIARTWAGTQIEHLV